MQKEIIDFGVWSNTGKSKDGKDVKEAKENSKDNSKDDSKDGSDFGLEPTPGSDAASVFIF